LLGILAPPLPEGDSRGLTSTPLAPHLATPMFSLTKRTKVHIGLQRYDSEFFRAMQVSRFEKLNWLTVYSNDDDDDDDDYYDDDDDEYAV